VALIATLCFLQTIAYEVFELMQPAYYGVSSSIYQRQGSQTVDKIFAYDYEHSGKLDYLVAYRPGSGIIWILKNTNGLFTQVF
jgi:hypothetical protein